LVRREDDEREEAIQQAESPRSPSRKEAHGGSAHAVARVALKQLRAVPTPVTTIPANDAPRLVPWSDPLRPPAGAPRASAAGEFEIPSAPRPDPEHPPAYRPSPSATVASSSGAYGVPDLLADDPSTLQLFHAPRIEPVVDEEEPGDEVAVQAFARPAQESGPWERDSPPDADHVPAAPMRPRRY